MLCSFPGDLPVISTTEPSDKQSSHGTQGYDIMRGNVITVVL